MEAQNALLRIVAVGERPVLPIVHDQEQVGPMLLEGEVSSVPEIVADVEGHPGAAHRDASSLASASRTRRARIFSRAHKNASRKTSRGCGGSSRPGCGAGGGAGCG